MPFNYTMPTNVTSFPALGTYLNDVSSDLFGVMLLMSVFAVCFISFRDWRLETNLITCCWVSFVCSLMMWLLGWVNFAAVVLFLLATAVMMIWRPGGGQGE